MNKQLSIINPSVSVNKILKDNLKIKVFEYYFNANESATLFDKLLNNTKWKNETVNVWGVKHSLRRRTAWYGDEGKSYSYSGITVLPNKWYKELLQIKNKIEEVTPIEFNSVLINDYLDGNIGMGWHSDDEKELGENPIIGSVSFGAERDFYLKSKQDSDREKVKIKATNGSYILMMDNTQHHWLHSIPIRKKIKDRRINLTFRKIL